MTPVAAGHTLDAEQRRQTTLQATRVWNAGGLVVFPTETVYGIGASAASEAGMAALQAFKGDTGQPFAVHLPTPAAAERYIDPQAPSLGRLLQKLLPGPVTLVLDVDEAVIDQKMRGLAQNGLPESVRGRLYHSNRVALRCPEEASTRELLGAMPAPVLASSAARPGRPAPLTAQQAAAAVGDAAALVIDGGTTRYAKPSTMLRVDRQGRVTVERPGVLEERTIRRMLRWTMLLVCSGNTCRSPMAEVIARDLLASERKLRPEQLEDAGVQVISAGAFASAGAPASAEAVAALAKAGLDLSKHRSRRLSAEMIRDADVIYGMTRAHVEAVLRMAPNAAQKTFRLDPAADIEDPIGSDTTVYQRTAEVIRRKLLQRIKEQQP